MYYAWQNSFRKTKKYRDWIAENQPLLEAGLDKAEKFPIVVNVQLMDGREWNSRADLDGVIKPICDLLVRAQIVPDDQTRYIQDVVVKFLPWPSKKSSVLMTISYEEPEEASEWQFFSQSTPGSLAENQE